MLTNYEELISPAKSFTKSELISATSLDFPSTYIILVNAASVVKSDPPSTPDFCKKELVS